MENLYFGIITIFICIWGYFYAYRQYSRSNIMVALLLIMLCGLLLRIYTATDFYLHAWDERYHALVAKNLINDPLKPMLYNNPVLPFDYRNWTANHIWIHKQPFPLWTMALSMSLFGVNEIALRLPSVILTTLGIGITFYIGRYFFNSRVGIIAAFLFSIHGLIIELTAGRVATDHTDVFFLFFVQLSVLLAIRYFQSKRAVFNVLCGISTGLAILSKWLPALIVLPVWLLLALDTQSFSRKKIILNFFLLLVVIALISMPWQWYIFNEFPKEALWESSFNLKHITEALENHGEPFYYHFDKIRILYGEFIYLALIWFFLKTIRQLKNFRRLILLTWIIIPLIFFSIAKTKMQAYTLFAAPAFFIVAALFWDFLFIYRNRFRYKLLISIILILAIAFPIIYSIERTKPFTIRERNPQWTKELRTLNEQIKEKKNIVVFNSEHPIETMFYTDCVAYSTTPDSSTLYSLHEKGYEIYIRNDLKTERINNHHQKSDLLITGPHTQYVRWRGKE